jgi:release factor glutamine methyltransferase
MTVLEILKKTEEFFKAKGLDSPRLNAELLLSHLLKCKRIELYVNFDKPLHEEEVNKFREYIKRRAAREPLQYITGDGPFHSFSVHVGPGVLIPRPETETLVETLFDDYPGLSGKSILDMGTGSGILAIVVKKHCPGCEMAACDVSEEALKVARENGKKLDAEIRWVKSDVFSNLSGKTFDLILSNPPYCKSGDLEKLEPEVRDHEPRLALDGGPDGLAFYRRFMTDAASHLNPGGRIYLEVGEGQAQDVAALGMASGLSLLKIVKDLSGKERVVVLERRN